MSEIMRRFVVTGRVQGVGFRAWTQRRAERLGLEGWVRNRRDGSVECLLIGSVKTVAEMEQALHQGPRGGQVDAVREVVAEPDREGDPAPAEGFVVAPTA